MLDRAIKEAYLTDVAIPSSHNTLTAPSLRSSQSIQTWK